MGVIIKRYHLYLLLILALALFFRLAFLDSIPPLVWEDELFNLLSVGNLAYNLHSVSGDFLPLFYGNIVGELRSQEALYLYWSIPSIIVFGFTQFGLRFSSVWIGCLAVIVSFFFAKQFFDYRIGLLTAFLLAVSPWHVQFSRLAFRAVTVSLLVPLSFYLLKKGFDSNKWFILLSVFFFGLSLYTYTVVLLFLPLVLFSFLIIYREQVLKYKYEFIVFFLILFLFCIPIVLNSLFNAHVSNTSVFAPNCEFLFPDTPDNKFVAVLLNYVSFFSPDFLFFNGDVNLRHSVRGIGLLHFFELPLLIIGLFLVFFKRSSSDLFILSWLFLSFIPASLTCGPTNASRGIVVLPVLHLIGAVAFSRLLNGFLIEVNGEVFDLTRVFLWLLSFFIIFCLINYGVELFVNYPSYSSTSFNFVDFRAAKFAVNAYDEYEVFYNFKDVYLFYFFSNKSLFFYPNYLRGRPVLGTKFEWCYLNECDFSRNNLLLVKSSLAFNYLREFHEVSIIKRLVAPDNSSSGLLVSVNP